MITVLILSIFVVESGNNPAVKPGDGGKALGIAQIWRVYWIDAASNLKKEHPKEKHTYQRVCEPKYAAWTIVAYAKRYSPKELAILVNPKQHTQAEVYRAASIIARRHNGGPKGDRKKATIEYGKKVICGMKTIIRKSKTMKGDN